MSNDSGNINNIINNELNYTWKNSQGTTMNDVKLGSGGLSSSATQGSKAANSFSGRAGFLALFTYSSKPVGYPDVSE